MERQFYTGKNNIINSENVRDFNMRDFIFNDGQGIKLNGIIYVELK